MNRIVVCFAMAVSSACVLAADSGQIAHGSFEGKVVVEWLDDPYLFKMRLTEDLQFRQAGGKTWVVPTGAIVDGRSMPMLFVSLMGYPFQSSFRKTAVVYDYVAQSQKESWEDAQHMFYDGALAEGILPVEAKVMYTLLNATGLRWEIRGSADCYGRCHARDADLDWTPKVHDEQVLALVSWVRTEDPSLDDIERQVGSVILEKGPHIIGRIHLVPEQR